MSFLDEPLWDIRQTAAVLGVPVSTLHYWRARSEGPPAFKIGRHLRYAPEEVRQWILNHRLPHTKSQ